ncbi:hypothetical protein BIW11_03446 [Tropilaelaps mercedesae]|uniref:Uncharacterized protein n=1 Tax=Tropilaelaps mercedesae TaxID=418985 RepID=A0A1V9XL67_9ACAR|nr:hypothetical protein BIW11_03446 [Tropilaelaps mercedesae]
MGVSIVPNLKEYLMHASHTAKELPAAFTLVNVMDTLRNVAHKIGDGTGQYAGQQSAPPPAQRALLSRVEELLRNPLGEVFNIVPYGKIAQEKGQGRQIFPKRIFDFHPERAHISDSFREESSCEAFSIGDITTQPVTSLKGLHHNRAESERSLTVSG